jgi:hypothetical protein
MMAPTTKRMTKGTQIRNVANTTTTIAAARMLVARIVKGAGPSGQHKNFNR